MQTLNCNRFAEQRCSMGFYQAQFGSFQNCLNSEKSKCSEQEKKIIEKKLKEQELSKQKLLAKSQLLGFGFLVFLVIFILFKEY